MPKLTQIIEPSPTWDIIDSSKLSTYMDCPRQFFYKYVLGWERDYPNNHLVFGTAWHAAVEHLLLNGYNDASLTEAKFIFLQYYRDQLPEESDELYSPKRPTDAFNALDLYVKHFKNDLHKYEILYTEVGGIALIGEDSPMHFKIDAIARLKELGKNLILDHKTSQRKMSNWSSSWQLKTQLLFYLHVLYCLYPSDEIEGARVRGSFFYKSKENTFDEAVIKKDPNQMQAWINSCNHWYNSLKYDMELLSDCDGNDVAMDAFPQNDQACEKYYGCPFLDMCNAWPNPIQHAETPPIGMRVRYWDPRDIPTIRETIDLT